jgi:hypothetical protein
MLQVLRTTHLARFLTQAVMRPIMSRSATLSTILPGVSFVTQARRKEELFEIARLLGWLDGRAPPSLPRRPLPYAAGRLQKASPTTALLSRLQLAKNFNFPAAGATA